jgi:geranylgeranylglycerol-phosphate geranylgeranyltransferase
VSALRAFWYLLAVIRPHNCLIAAASVAVGAFLASHMIQQEAVIALLVAFLACAGAFALNDVFDIESDRIVKPWRPLPSGHLKPRVVVIGVALVWVAACPIALVGGKAITGFFVAWILMLWLYSWKIKTLGLPGHILISLTASSGFILGAIIGGDVRAGFLPTLIALPLHLAREIIKSVVDAEGDRSAGVGTLAVRIGEQRAIALSLWIIGGVIVLSFLPFLFNVYGYLYMLPVAVVIYPLLLTALHLLLRTRTEIKRISPAAHTSARLLKSVMPVGLLAFFLAGV